MNIHIEFVLSLGGNVIEKNVYFKLCSQLFLAVCLEGMRHAISKLIIHFIRLASTMKRLWAAFLLPLYKHTILVLSIIFCSGTLLALWYLSNATTTLVQSAALQGITLHAASLMELRKTYTLLKLWIAKRPQH